MDRPIVPEQHFDRIPDELKRHGLFCCWQYDYASKNHRWQKVPYIPGTNHHASYKNEKTFKAYGAAIKGLQVHSRDGIGIFPSRNLVFVDVDDCIINDEIPDSEVVDLIDKLKSYTEISVGGHGIHIICLVDDLKLPCAPENYSAMFSKEYSTGNGTRVEVYGGQCKPQYLTLSGNALSDSIAFEGLFQPFDLADRTADIKELVFSKLKKQANETENNCEQTTPVILDDDFIVRKLLTNKNSVLNNLLWNGDLDGVYDFWQEQDKNRPENERHKDFSQTPCDLALTSGIAFFTQDPEQIDRIFRESGLMRSKWDEVHGGCGKTYGMLTIEKALSKLQKVWTPDYNTENAFQDLLPSNGDASPMIVRAYDFICERDVFNNPRYTMDDIGSGFLLADFLKPFARPISKDNVWIVYDGRRWTETNSGAIVLEATKALARGLIICAAKSQMTDAKLRNILIWVGGWTSHGKRSVYIQEAASVYPVMRSDFDKNPYVLNCLNGTLNLRTKELKPHNPDDMLSMLADVEYDPNAENHRWEQFIDEIMIPGESELADFDDPEQIADEKARFLQRYLGLSLSGDVRQECFAIFFGSSSRNGKSVCCGAVSGVLGDYAKNCSPETVLEARNRNGSGPSEDIARLKGARLLTIPEIPQNARLDSSRVKTLTGRDPLTARLLHQSSFQFVPDFKIVMHTNHLPKTNDMSVFDSNRVLVLPFSRHFSEAEQDKNLKDLFASDEAKSAILNWLLQGFDEYERLNGLCPPAAVKNAIRKYREDSDKFARFIDERLQAKSGAKTRFTEVYRTFQDWCVASGYLADSKSSFKSELEKRSVTIARGRASDGTVTSVVIGYEIATTDFGDIDLDDMSV